MADTSKKPNIPESTLVPAQNAGKEPRQPIGSNTLRPSVSDIFRQAISTTGRQRQNQAASLHIPVTDATFTFGSTCYKREELISSTTGEAEIFLVSHDTSQYVLKLYYKGYYPSADVLETLRRNNGNGYLVDIVDYGLWHSENGEERFGVLMPYYSGGVLKGGEMRGKPEELEKIAIQTIEAVHYCHTLGILHKDIKPNNFIYTDETRTRIVLADFGIASVFTRDSNGKIVPFVNINQNRTYIYASPELFNLTIQRSDGKVEVEYTDIKSDYFALGMTLLVLWMGEAPFALLDERSLLKLKRGERSGLPYPEDIPKRTRHLIKGLTVASPDNRWGHAEYQRWHKGENVAVDNPTERPHSLRVLYNGSKGQVATSIKQLAALMLDDPSLGEQYLYSGKISEWMAEAGFPEWQMRIDSIVNKQYPKSRRSGLLTACYKMNPQLPFVGVKGDKCYTPLDVARELAHNAEEYSQVLKDWEAPLYIYFSSHSIDTGTKHQQLFKQNPWIALWRLVYAIAPECEFPLWSTSENAIVWCATVDQLVEVYAESSHDRYASFNSRSAIGRYTPMLLSDESFLTWLAHRSAEKAELIREALSQEKSHGAEIYNYIFYLLRPDRNYFYEDTTESNFTIGHIGQLLNQDLIDYNIIGRYNNNQHFFLEEHKRTEQLAHYHDTKLYYYLKSKGQYQEQFDFIDSCFDLHSIESQKKCGPYNSRLAALKVCHYFAGETFYYFPVCAKTVTRPNQLADIPHEELTEELHKGFLVEWLAVQYQENPHADLAEEHSYEKLTLEFMQQIKRIDPAYTEVELMDKCIKQVEEDSATLNRLLSKIKKSKWILISITAVILAMIGFLLAGGVNSVPNDDKFTYNVSAMLYIAAPVFVLMIIPPIQSFVNDLTKGILGSPILFALAFSNFIVVGWEVLRLYLMPYSYISVPVLFGLSAIWVLCTTFISKRTRKRKYQSCVSPSFEVTHIEPLRFTWHEGTDPYKEFCSSVSEQTKEYTAKLKHILSKLKSGIRKSALLLIMLAIVFVVSSRPISEMFFKYLPIYSTSYGRENAVEQFDKEGQVQIYICTVDRYLTVRAEPTNKSQVIGKLSTNSIVEVVGFDGNYAKILYEGQVAYVLRKYIKPLE